MISLVITIILIIILASVTFLGSKSTIDNATYSTYVNNVSEVVAAFEKTTLDMNSEEELIKEPKLDEQIFNYVARGGENLEFLEYEELPAYTVMVKEVNIGMELPEMKVESGTGRVIPIKYASTLKGKIFTWPPYEHEGKLYITNDDTVEHKMQTEISVGNERLTIIIDSGDGSLLDAVPGEGYYDPEWDEDLPFESETPEEIPSAEAHLFTQKTPTEAYLVSEATCTQPAKYYYKCISCDEKGTNTYNNGAALGHEWDTYKVTKSPNCRDTGTKERTCQRCGEIELVSIAKDTKTHIGEEVEEVTRVASCTETERKTTKCSACNVVLKVQEGDKNPDNHTGGESAQITKQVTCTEDGTKVTTCVGCNKVLRTEAIPAFGHTFGPFVVTKESTCSVKGTKQRTCSTCGVNEIEELPLDSSNHKGSSTGEERTEPTCTANGKVDTKCSLCGGVLSTQTLAALGHSYKSVVTEPTVEAQGYTTHTCTRCGDSYVDSYVPKLVITAFAVYSETDNSLRFYKNTDTVNVGDTYKNLKVTEKYLDIETTDYENVGDIPWTGYSGDILKVIVEEEIIPISTKSWFAGFTNTTSMDLSKLNTSKVTTMRQMFRGCSSIQTLSINHFETSEVTDMYAMFWGAISLENLDLSNWNTSKVTDMAYMFGAYEEEMALKEIDLSSWNTESLTNTRVMFQNCTKLEKLDLSGWKTQAVTDMRYMFNKTGRDVEVFEIKGLDSWDTSNVTNMVCIFQCAGENATTWSIGDLSNWDTSSVTTMEYAFMYAGNNLDTFEIDLSEWDTSSVTDMGYMFYAAGQNSSTWSVGDLSGWDISKVKYLDCTFAYAGQNATSWTVGNLDNWNVSNVLNMTSLFAQAGQNATTFNLGNLENWNTAKVINMSNLFSNAGKNSSTWNVGDLSKWNTSNVTNMYQMFGYTGLKASTFDIGDISTKTVTKADGTTYTAWDTSKVTNMAGMFTWGGYGASTFDIGDVGTWDVSSVTLMNYMFNQAGCMATTWNIGDLSNWNTKSVTSLYGTFHMAGYNATTFDIGDLSTKIVTKADGTTYTAWDVSNVTTMYRLFGSAGRVASEFNLGDIGTWNIPNLKEMQYMFAGAGQQATSFYVGDLGDLNTSNVTNMLGIFENAGRNSSPITLDLSNWDTSKVTYAVNASGETTSGMNEMFSGMRRLHTITLGSNFSTTGDGTCTFSLPTIDTSYFTESDGLWYDIATGIGYAPDAIPTNTAATYSVEPPIEAFAIYSEEDNSLRFYKNGDLNNIAVNGEYNELTVTSIYTGFETDTYTSAYVPTTPWFEHSGDILTVVVEEEIAPISTAYWFMNLRNLSTGDLTKLNTSSVTNMSQMFYNAGYSATTFDIGDLSSWDTSKVTSMSSMFYQAGYSATTWNIGDLSNWDTSKVTSMLYMFNSAGYSATTFELDLSSWDTSSVTSMVNMFYQAGYSATTWSIGDLSNWDTSNITNMSNMFYNAGNKATTFDIGDLSNWDTLSATSMSQMFCFAGYSATTFELDLSNWDTSSVTDMSYMFYFAGRSATTWNIGDLSNWDTSKVTSMSSMFSYAGRSATTFELDLSSWDTSKVKNMADMFSYAGGSATTFDIGDLSNWDTSKVTSMSSMFSSAGRSATTWNIGDLSNWDTSKVTSMSYMFNYAGYSATTWSIGDLSNWDTSNVTNMLNMFYYAGYNSSAITLDLSGWDTSSVTNMSHMFYQAGYEATTWNIGDLSGWDTSSVTTMYNMFYNAGRSATTWNIGDLSNWDTSKVTSMSQMFFQAGYKATTWNIGDLSGWDTSSVTLMSHMFRNAGYSATTFELDLSSWDTSSVTNMSYMFSFAGRSATTWSIGDLSNWDTSNVTNMSYMFYCAGRSATTFELDLSSWDTSKVTSMSNMFNCAGHSATTFELDLSSWDTSKVTSMSYMFNYAGYSATTWNIGNLSNWDTSSVTNMYQMFYYAGYNSTPITLDLSSWDTSSVTDSSSNSMDGMVEMFEGMKRLHTITLGSSFSTTGDGTCTFSLPTIDTSYFTESDGLWYDIATGIGYAPDAIPTNTATTYSVEKILMKEVDGLGDVIVNDPDVELEYDPDDGTLGGVVPPSEDTPEEPEEIPEEELPEIIEVGFGNFEPVTTYTPGTYKEVPYEQSYTKTKYPVSYKNVTWSEWTITKDADGNVISTVAGDMQLEDIDEVYSTWIVYDMETEKYLESNGVKGDSLELWAPFIAAEDSLENMVYLAAYLNKTDGKTTRHIAKHDGTKYVAYDADADITAITCFTETYTVTGTKTVQVTAPSSSTEYVYVPIGTLRAEKGMTWEAWLASEYNTTGNTIPTIKTSDYVDVAYTDVIDENLDYGFIVYELDGIWLWNDDADFWGLTYDVCDYEGIININFTSNRETFIGMYSNGVVSPELLYYKNESEYVTAYGILGATQGSGMVSSWNTDYQIIDFGSTPQYVSKEFYEWFIENAEMTEETTTCCFVAGTQVMYALDGSTKNIEDFKAGDLVVSYDFETGENYIAEVQGLIIKENSTNMARLHLADGTIIEMTDYHPIYTQEGWHSITNHDGYDTLVEGDMLKTSNGWVELLQIELYVTEPKKTYNLAIKDFDEEDDDDTNDNFYVNDVLAHNAMVGHVGC